MYFYQNNETGEILTRRQMLKQWAEWYDGGDPTNAADWTENYTKIFFDIDEQTAREWFNVK